MWSHNILIQSNKITQSQYNRLRIYLPAMKLDGPCFSCTTQTIHSVPVPSTDHVCSILNAQCLSRLPSSLRRGGTKKEELETKGFAKCNRTMPSNFLGDIRAHQASPSALAQNGKSNSRSIHETAVLHMYIEMQERSVRRLFLSACMLQRYETSISSINPTEREISADPTRFFL